VENLARVEAINHALTHPSGRGSGGVASLAPRLISGALSGQAPGGCRGRPNEKFFRASTRRGRTNREVRPHGRGLFALPPAPSRSHPGTVDRASFRGRGRTRAAGPRASHRSDSPTPARGVGSTSARGVESTPGDSTSQLTLSRSPTRGGAADAWDKFENLSGPRCLAYPPALGRGRILPCRCGRVDKRSSRIGWKPLLCGQSPPPFQIAPFGASRRPIREGIMTRELSVRRRLLCPGLLPENRRT
jgi:hypothetical protein